VTKSQGTLEEMLQFNVPPTRFVRFMDWAGGTLPTAEPLKLIDAGDNAIVGLEIPFVRLRVTDVVVVVTLPLGSTRLITMASV
jgi:hypothetical protein